VSLSNLASIGSLISGVAVLISLVYLALQVRQAARNQRALMQQGRADRVANACIALAQPGISRVYNKGLEGDENLTPEELEQFIALCRAAFLSGEDTFLQHLSGHFDEVAYSSVVAGARAMLRSPGLRACWRISAAQFGPEYRAFMDSLIRETPVAPPSDRLAQWNELVRAEKAGGA
jgi:hypothetical protein